MCICGAFCIFSSEILILFVFIIIVLRCTALLSYLTDVMPHLGVLSAAAAMHNIMLSGILRAPLQFLDSTPSGRVLARFSRDVEVLDAEIPDLIIAIVYCYFEVI